MKKILLLIPLLALVGTAGLLLQSAGTGASQGVAKGESTTDADTAKTKVTGLKTSTRGAGLTVATATTPPQTKSNVLTATEGRLSHPLGDRIRAGIRNGEMDPALLAQLKLELQRNTTQTGREMLAAMQVESDPTVLIMLANLLGENPDVMMAPEAIKGLMEMTDSGQPEKRQAALAALSFANTVSPELLNRVTMMSREDDSNAVRVSAIAAMSVWIGRTPGMAKQLSQELVATARATDNTTVRGHAIQLIANQSQKLPDNVMQELQGFLKTETLPQNRQLAAYGLGGATGSVRTDALVQLEQAYARETDMDTRRVILMQITRAGLDDAPAILKRLPADGPLLQNDIKDYLDFLAQGMRNADDIWTQKSLRDADRGTEIGMTHASGAALN